MVLLMITNLHPSCVISPGTRYINYITRYSYISICSLIQEVTSMASTGACTMHCMPKRTFAHQSFQQNLRTYIPSHQRTRSTLTHVVQLQLVKQQGRGYPKLLEITIQRHMIPVISMASRKNRVTGGLPLLWLSWTT